MPPKVANPRVSLRSSSFSMGFQGSAVCGLLSPPSFMLHLPPFQPSTPPDSCSSHLGAVTGGSDASLYHKSLLVCQSHQLLVIQVLHPLDFYLLPFPDVSFYLVLGSIKRTPPASGGLSSATGWTG